MRSKRRLKYFVLSLVNISAIDDSDYLKMRTVLRSLILRLNRLRRLKITVYYPSQQISRLLLSRLMSAWLS